MDYSAQATGLKQLFQGIAPKGSSIVVGKVTATGPLKIQVENDGKLVLSGRALLVPQHLTDWEVKVDISLGDGSINAATSSAEGHSHNVTTFSISGATMKVKNALKEGDEVYLFAFNQGKNYLVIDRVG